MAEMQNPQVVTETNLTHLTPIASEGNEGNLQESDYKDFLMDAVSQMAVEDDSPSSIDLVERYLGNNYDFRINQVLGRLEFKKKEEVPFSLLDDLKFNSIIRELMKRKIRISKDALKSIIYSDFAPVYNPFTSYFNNLPVWDGRTDYIKQLAETVKTNNDVKWQEWFKKWIVAVVACATDDKQVNHTAIVFAGKQGIGKTSWMYKLVPDPLKRYFYSGIPNLNNKDTKIRMAECFLINLDEMDNLTSSNTEKLKEIITAPEIKVRRAYAHFDESMPRRASFMGSVNNKQFLNDTTGNRRFLCFDVSEIQFNHSINMDMVYAQAKHLLNSGFPHFFNAEEIEEVAESNEQFQAISYIEELILKWLVPVKIEEETPQHKWTATEIAQFLSGKSNLQVNDSLTQKIGKYMKKYEFPRIKSGGVYVYALKEKVAIQILTA
ncbi:VapE domain-containing protein [Chitinophaga filiformis]|uniref:Virulence-associated E family protein n=1 Tax=Chitinophaga filiformis TaxID=104663 RepID=A0ABY4HZ60_CHIFI|nr:VapE domain-containing protein [Chitinophaga filiformis]UPK68309.1 virulence-associated E family protein [Chitinophaga filiformis]